MHWTKVQYTPPSKFLNCPPVLKVSVASRPSRHDTIAMNVKCPRNFPALSTILAALLLSAQGLHATDAPEVEADHGPSRQARQTIGPSHLVADQRAIPSQRRLRLCAVAQRL